MDKNIISLVLILITSWFAWVWLSFGGMFFYFLFSFAITILYWTSINLNTNKKFSVSLSKLYFLTLAGALGLAILRFFLSWIILYFHFSNVSFFLFSIPAYYVAKSIFVKSPKQIYSLAILFFVSFMLFDKTPYLLFYGFKITMEAQYESFFPLNVAPLSVLFGIIIAVFRARKRKEITN